MRDALAAAVERDVPVVVLGGGSNVVVSDAGFPGLVVKMAIGGLDFTDDGASVRVTAGAGVAWDALVRDAVARGLQGVECLSGIPGSVGATPIQNVGAYGQEVAETIERVVALDRRSLAPVEFTAAQSAFAYRSSRFKTTDRDRYVVTSVVFRLRRGGPPAPRYAELAAALERRPGWRDLTPVAGLAAVRDAVLDLRRAKAMVLDAQDPDTRSVGSFFVNPVLGAAALEQVVERWRAAGGEGAVPAYAAPGGFKVPAAWLIERAGFLKGYRREGVGISRRHALALVNAGGTTAELLALAADIEAAVAARFGVRLEREPVMIG